MEIIDFYASDDQKHWLDEIQKSDWTAGKYLYGLLRDQKLKELCGESTKVLLRVNAAAANWVAANGYDFAGIPKTLDFRCNTLLFCV